MGRPFFDGEESRRDCEIGKPHLFSSESYHLKNSRTLLLSRRVSGAAMPASFSYMYKFIMQKETCIYEVRCIFAYY